MMSLKLNSETMFYSKHISKNGCHFESDMLDTGPKPYKNVRSRFLTLLQGL